MNRGALLLSAATAVVAVSCSPISTSTGRGGSETTNGFAVSIRHSDGTPASGALSRLRPSDYLSPLPGAPETAGFRIDTITGSDGRFSVADIPAGNYCVEVQEDAGGGGSAGALLVTFTIGSDDTIDQGCDTLRAAAAIEGTIDTANSVPVRYMQVRGLERLERIGTDGSFALRGLPAGALSVRIAVPDASAPAREVDNIRTSAGNTSRMRLAGSWSGARRIYFNTTASGANVQGNVYGFPLLLRFDSTTFAFSGAMEHGEDLRFGKTDGTPLPFEIEEWNASAKRGAVWVRIDTIFGNSTEHSMLMTWGDLNSAGASGGLAVFDTVSGYVGVWHMSGTMSGAADELHDATANHLDGQGGGGDVNALPKLTTGICGPAQQFDGTSFVRLNDADVLHFDSSLCISFWVYYQKKSSENQRFIAKDGDWSVKENGNRPQFTVEDSAYLAADALLTQDTWNFVTITVRNLNGAAEAAIYINGRATASFENTFATYTPGARVMDDFLYFGQQGNGAFFLTGLLDEIRLQRTLPTENEIRLNYESQKTGSSFVELTPR